MKTRLRRTLLGLFLLSVLVSPLIPQAADLKSVARDYLPKLEKNLKENIVSFWLSKSLDQKNGGYLISFDQRGEPLANKTKMIVTQARQVWLFSRLAREGYGGKEYLAAADLGYRFLRDKMWDAKHGGFYWLVDESGNQALLPGKVMYGQSFGLYAVSEYYLATRNEEALKLARRLFDLMEAKAHDPVYGGYQEKFAADWSPSNLTREYFGAGSAAKLMNTHLHLMEAMTCFYRASRLPLARERLLELITIQSNSVVRKGIGACTDRYEQDWQPILTGGGSTVSYGHDLENIWLLVDACDAAEILVSPLQDLFQTLFEYSMKYGFDAEKGGFYSTGAPNQPASDRSKTWWVQAEAMVSALYMHRLTGDPKYLEIFAKTYDFVDNYQVDWKVGEWHPTVSTDGKGSGSKANAWKAGYHNGRAMIEGIAILKKAL